MERNLKAWYSKHRSQALFFFTPSRPFFLLVVGEKNCYYFGIVDTQKILKVIENIETPFKRQLLMVALITRILEEKGKSPPIIIGGCALSYYSREVYFTSDIDLAYADRDALNIVLTDIGFEKRGRYWVSEGLKMAIEAPTSTPVGEDSPIEIVEVGEGLQCRIIGIEDLIIERMNAFKHRKSEMDGEMVELLIQKYRDELDWAYLERKAALPENDIFSEIRELKQRPGNEG